MTAAKLRLLLLSTGSLAAQNVIDALGERRARCELIGTNSLAEAAGNFRCDAVHLVPPAASGTDYVDRIARIIRAERPDLVIPSRDDDVLALARVRERNPDIESVLLAGSVASARIWEDKVETARFAARHGLPFAETAQNVAQALALLGRHPLPLIGKPRAGNGSRGVVLLRSIGEIEQAFAARGDLIAQPFIDPPRDMESLIAPFAAGLPLFFSFPNAYQYVVTVIVGPDRTLSRPFAWLCRLVGGQSIDGGRCDDPHLLDICTAYASAAAEEGWAGPVNMQWKRTPEGRFVAFELNGRFGGGTAARTVLGFDEVGEAIRMFLPGADFPVLAERECDAVQKYLRTYPVPRDGVAALRRSGEWRRSRDAAGAAPA
jgi:carbamoyl-phosphate synthase large subunit